MADSDGKVIIAVTLEDDGTVKDAEVIGRKAGDEAGKAYGDGFSGKAADALKKFAVAAGTAMAAGTVAIGKAALDAYAEYEQLVGGVDTLFKDSSAQLQAYAAEAYKNQGMSANTYMSTVTQFSASLINSLGGDTAKAAEYANIAVTDMADNANKMGTSIETIQETYSSLARGNYAMLDNLKLGFAGTKAGMEDLLAAAEGYKAAQGEVVDYSIDSYADIVEAIHVVQEEMGIAGATAAEAMGTIEGSVNMAKAAWENWLTGLGDSNADVATLTVELVESVSVAASNIVPRIGQILTTLATLLMTQLPVILDQLIAYISANGVNMATAALDFFLQMLFALLQATPQILTALLLMLASLVVAIYQKASEFLSQGVGLMASLAQGIADGASYVVSEIARGIDEGVQRVRDKVDAFFDAGSAIVGGLVDGIRSAIERVTSAASDLMASVRAYLPFSPAKVGPFSGKGWSLYSGRSIVEALAQGMKDAEGSALASVSGVMGDFQAAISPSVAYAGGVTHSSTATYSFGDIHINASDLAGMRAVEEFLSLIETA